MANVIRIRGTYGRPDEAVAGAAGIYPGMLLKKNSSGEAVIHDDEGGFSERMVAVENALLGGTTTTVYTSGEALQYVMALPGEELMMLLEDEQNAIIGSQLISAGNGKLKLVGDLESGEVTDQIIAEAMEAQDLTGSNTSDTLTKVRML